jgi:MFS family permease
LTAWLIASLYFFYQYALRSAPSVMMPQLSNAFGLGAASTASLVGLFYYGYAPFSLVAGAAMDGLGPRKVLPIGVAAVGVGALLFASGSSPAAGLGRFMQGAGGSFGFVGAAFIATTSFPPSRAATLIGATQMFGMAGGSAGQFLVGPMIASGIDWTIFWYGMGIAGVAMGALFLVLLPASTQASQRDAWLKRSGTTLFAVFRNPQSILCGLIAGLLFTPTTIFDMVWGVRYLQEAHGFDYGSAVMRSATVPFGWIVGCPLLGFLSDRLGRRKPVIVAGAIGLFACLAWILFGPTNVFPPYAVGLATGLVSGAAMLPYTVINEANPGVSGAATGVVNFLNMGFTAMLSPVFGWLLTLVGRVTERTPLARYQTAFVPMLFGVALAVVLTLLLNETGPAVRRTASA